VDVNEYTFKREGFNSSVEYKHADDYTWWELTDHFVDFLRGCGFQMTRQEISDYLVEDIDPLTSTEE
jgi:hypothetical protein